jgi:SOS-response transcriptional repressor LexA
MQVKSHLTLLINFKQFKMDGGRPYLKPLNPSHPNIFDEFKVLGKVIGASLKL